MGGLIFSTPKAFAEGIGFFQVNLNQLLAVTGSTKDAFTVGELAHGVDLAMEAHYEKEV